MGRSECAIYCTPLDHFSKATRYSKHPYFLGTGDTCCSSECGLNHRDHRYSVRENGRPLASWKFAFTLNTIVAALGTVARTTLAFAISACIGQQKWNWFRRKSDRLVAFERFDEASRGPYGGAKLFFWLRLRCEILMPVVRETNTFTDTGLRSEPWSLWVSWRSILSSRQLYPLSEDPPISQQMTTP